MNNIEKQKLINTINKYFNSFLFLSDNLDYVK